MATNKLKKYNKGKPPVSKLPPLALLETAKVMGAGSAKYDDPDDRTPNFYNFAAAGDGVMIYVDAALRHLLKHVFLYNYHYQDVPRDHEDGTIHLANAAASVLIALELLLIRTGIGDQLLYQKSQMDD